MYSLSRSCLLRCHSPSRRREVERSVCYLLSRKFYALCLQPPLSVRAVKRWCSFPCWYTHYFTPKQQHLRMWTWSDTASIGILASTYLARVEPSYGQAQGIPGPGIIGSGSWSCGGGLRPVRLLNCSRRINESLFSSSPFDTSNWVHPRTVRMLKGARIWMHCHVLVRVRRVKRSTNTRRDPCRASWLFPLPEDGRRRLLTTTYCTYI